MAGGRLWACSRLSGTRRLRLRRRASTVEECGVGDVGGRWHHAVGPRRAKRRLGRPDVAAHDLPASLETDASAVGIGPLSLSREMGERVRHRGSLWRGRRGDGADAAWRSDRAA